MVRLYFASFGLALCVSRPDFGTFSCPFIDTMASVQSAQLVYPEHSRRVFRKDGIPQI